MSHRELLKALHIVGDMPKQFALIADSAFISAYRDHDTHFCVFAVWTSLHFLVLFVLARSSDSPKDRTNRDINST
jgi:hypothetical protein